MDRKNLIFVIITFSLCYNIASAQPSPFGFKNQFIGNTRYVTPEEEKNRTFCNNYWCINDANLLFTKSSQYPNVDPCVDFRNFSVNHIVEVDVPDDRLVFRGLETLRNEQYMERLRKVVAAKFDPVKDENSRVIKIVKNTFGQCLKSKHALRHIQAHKDIVEHLQSLGGSPYLSKHIYFNPEKFNEATDYGIDDIWTNNVPNSFNEDELWTGENFNVRKYFEIEPKHALSLFFDLEIKRCNNLMCLKRINLDQELADEKVDFDVYKELLRTLDDAFMMGPQMKLIFIDQVYKPAVKRMREFLRSKYEKIETLFEQSILNENDEILVEGGLELLKGLMKNLENTNKKFYNVQDYMIYGIKHGQQRWRSCIIEGPIYNKMQPALMVMYEQRRAIWDRTLGDFDRDLKDERADIVGSAKKLIYESVEEFKRRFLTECAPYLPLRVSADVLFKLKNLIVIIGLPKSIFPISKLEEFYKELKLNGNETFMTSFFEIEKFHQRVLNEPDQSWRRQINKIVDNHLLLNAYNIDDGNIYYFCPLCITYPDYHPLRPRFFNMATVFSDNLFILSSSVQNYIKDKYNITTNPVTTAKSQIAYEHYKNWLKTHNDLQIGANYLTNEQLFWVARSVWAFHKFHNLRHKTLFDIIRIQNDYLHFFFKNLKGFQEAFKCDQNEDEKKKLNELFQRLRNNELRNGQI